MLDNIHKVEHICEFHVSLSDAVFQAKDIMFIFQINFSLRLKQQKKKSDLNPTVYIF